MQEIKVKTKSETEDSWIFEVEVAEGDNKTVHTVDVDKSYYEKLTSGKIKPEELVKKSFEFLLSREPKESILKNFSLFEIQGYFPEYEDEMKNLAR